MRTPASLLRFATYACALLTAAVIFAALRMPAVGVRFAAADDRIAVTFAGGATTMVAAGGGVVFRGRSGELRQTARELVADFSPDGTPRAIAAWFGARDRLSRIITGDGATITLPGAAPAPLQARPHGLGDLPRDTWLLLAQGAIFTLLGTWIAAIKPAAWGARMFALSCAGLVAASFSGALYDARELSAGGALLHALQIVNFTGSLVSSAALLALFLCTPRLLARPRTALGIVAAAAVLGLLSGVGLLPLGTFYGGLLALTAGFVVVLIAQWRASRGDPVARATLRWVGLTTLIGSGQLAAAMALPQLLDLPSLAGDGMTIVPLAIVYGSIAFGIGRNRLFDLDKWTYRLMLGAIAAIGFLAIDAALVALVRLDGPVATVLTLLLIGYLYLPLRSFVWRKVAGTDRLSDGEKFQRATDVAFAASPAARRDGWRALLGQLFDPLSIDPATGPVLAAAVGDSGARLDIPAIADDVALRLHHHARGSRLFGSDQARLAGEMVALMRRAEIARAEYLRGVGEERRRIARDLHDDVCATLLTGLHRDDLGKLQTDVRGAMADIRTIIGGLTGERIELEQALADLRFETAERLSAAGIALDWPLPPRPHPARLLDYAVYRNLLSSHREAISNILKHARAKCVAVQVGAAGDMLSIAVQDDGRAGWDAAPADRGRGIANMRQRLAEIGGRFALASGDAGTRVDIVIPLA